MGIFKKTIKYSKPSKDLENKIKNLDEELKNTGVIDQKNDSSIFDVQKSSVEKMSPLYEEVEVKKEGNNLYDWRESFIDEELNSDLTEESINEVRKNHHKLSLVEGSIELIKVREAQSIFKELYQNQVEEVVEKYVSSHAKDIVSLREDLFVELKKKPSIDIGSLEEKINILSAKYKRLSEELVSGSTKSNDPLTQNPVTLEQLKNHYQILVGRLQEQLASIGGGGEVRLKYLDDIVGIATNPSVYNGKFLKYDHSLGKFIFENAALDQFGQVGYAITSGISTYSGYANVAGISTYAGYADISGIATYATNAGVATYASRSGIATYANVSGVSTSVSGGTGSLTQLNVSGVSTFSGITTVTGTTLFAKQLNVSGVSTFSGITTVTGTTLFAKQLNVSGVVTASSFIKSGGTSSQFLKADGSIDSNTYLTSFTETDPIFNASPAKNITNTQISNWDTSYGWGDHSTLGYATTGYVNTQIGLNTFTGAATSITSGQISNWDISYGWGNHSIVGYVTSGYVNTQIGLNTFTGAATSITSGQISNWDISYGWGNHSIVGYVTSGYVTNALVGYATTGYVNTQIGLNTFTGAATSITSGQISNWDISYGWGNHSIVGYLTSYTETDTLNSITNRGNLTANGISVGILTATRGNFSGIITSSGANISGVITALSFVGSGSSLTNLTGASPNTYGNSTVVPQIVVDNDGRISSITNVAISGVGGGGSGINVKNLGSVVGFAGTIDFGFGLGVSALSVGVVTVSSTINYVPNSGVSTYATTAGFSTIAGYATTAGISTTSQGLTGTPNILVGVVTATSFVGSGISLTGIVTSIIAGTGIAINQSTGNVTISATPTQWVTNASGIHTLSNVGIATTSPQTPLQVERYGVKTGFGTFNASAGIATDIDSFTISTNDFKTAEYTLHFIQSGTIQAQKVLVMQNGTTAYSQEYGVMSEPYLIVSVGATISAGVCKLQVTPETGVNGITTYRLVRTTLL
jgi:hypothetical protein